MSRDQTEDPMHDDGPAWLETVIVPRAHDLGGFEVRRALPSARRRMVGPFIFWDQMGPAVLKPGAGVDVRPHPHIGLATLTYLFDGEIMHRDSLGSVQAIRPGEVNLMTAGRGIVHSERTALELRDHPNPLFGIQSWIALPAGLEETDPGFLHLSTVDLPVQEGEGVALRLIAGELHGVRSPLPTPHPMVYADVHLDAGATVTLPGLYAERAVHIAQGRIAVAGDVFEAGRMLVFRPGDTPALRAEAPSRLLILGGEPMDGPRHIWWNFVSSSRDRIEQAKADWKAGRFPAVPSESEFIPLPE